MGMNISDRWAVALADFVVRRRWLVIIATLVAVFAIGAGARHLEFSNNYRVFFGADNPELIAFENFQATYTKNDNILFVVQPKDGKLFTADQAAAVERITAEAWKTPFSIRVDSVTNFQHSWADGDDLTVEDLVRNGVKMTPAELSRRTAIALAEPLLRGNLISRSAETTGVNIVLQYPEKSLTEVPAAVAHVRAVREAILKDHPDLTIALTGVSMLNNAFAESGQTDAATLIPIMYGVLLVFMIVMLRSVTGTFSTLLVIGFSTVAAMGFAGYVGIKLTPVSITAPTIVLTLAIADSIHILVTQLGLMREGMDKIAALKESIRMNALAVTITSITSITTIVGFLSMNFSDAPPFHDLGNITAAGIAAAWALSLAFLPAVISLLPLRVRENQGAGARMQRFMERVADLVIGRYRVILVIFGTVAVALAAMVPTIDLDDQWVKYFDHRIQFRGDAEFAIEHLAGLYPVEFSVKSGRPGGVSDPEYLAHLDAFTAWLRTKPEVRHVYSYTDIIKRLNKNMHGDRCRLVQDSRGAKPGGAVPAALRTVAALRSRSQRPDQHRQIGHAGDRHAGRNHDDAVARVPHRSRNLARRKRTETDAHQADQRLSHVRLYLAAQHREHVARQCRGHRPDRLDHGIGAAQCWHGRAQPAAQRGADHHDIWPLGAACRPGRHGFRHRHRDGARHRGGRLGPPADQISARPAGEGS